MTHNFTVFAPAVRIAMPTRAPSDRSSTLTKPRGAAHSRPSVVHEPLSITKNGVLCCRARPQPAASRVRAATIGCPPALSALIERP
jgi:hypothetical protein